MKNKKLNNKGFSLVELIIVVAIMAVLVGVLAPQYMRYVDRSRAGVDEQYADSIRSAMQTCLLDPNIVNGFTLPDPGDPDLAGTIDSTNAVDDATVTPAETFWANVYSIISVQNGDGAVARLTLDPDNATIAYAIDDMGNVSIQITGGDYAQFPVTVD